MHDTTKHWGTQLAGGIVLLAVVVVPASAVALVLNVRAGLEISVEAAVIYGLADVALVAVALVASVCGHIAISRAAIAACALLSLVSQVNAHMSNAGHAMRMAGEQNQALARAITKLDEAKDEAKTARNNAVTARTHAETARRSASEITERGTVADLEAAVARASRKAELALKTAAKQKKACRDAAECPAAQDASAAAKTALAQAHSKVALLAQAASEETRARQFDEDARRADAKAERAETSRAGIGGPAKTDGTTAFLAQTYGWDEVATGRWVNAAKTGLLLSATLLLQMLGGYAGRAIGNGLDGRRIAKAVREASKAEPTPAPTVAVVEQAALIKAEATPEAEPDASETLITYIDCCDKFRPVTKSVASILMDTRSEMMGEYMALGMLAEEMEDTTGATRIAPTVTSDAVLPETEEAHSASAPVDPTPTSRRKRDRDARPEPSRSELYRLRALKGAATRRARAEAKAAQERAETEAEAMKAQEREKAAEAAAKAEVMRARALKGAETRKTKADAKAEAERIASEAEAEAAQRRKEAARKGVQTRKRNKLRLGAMNRRHLGVVANDN